MHILIKLCVFPRHFLKDQYECKVLTYTLKKQMHENVSARTDRISTQNLIFCLTKSAPLSTGIRLIFFRNLAKMSLKVPTIQKTVLFNFGSSDFSSRNF